MNRGESIMDITGKFYNYYGAFYLCVYKGKKEGEHFIISKALYVKPDSKAIGVDSFDGVKGLEEITREEFIAKFVPVYDYIDSLSSTLLFIEEKTNE